ncbi:MAG: phosphoglycolate phosphatase [Proteobacteria bacterium]|nr:phosphoglycolate phosphatase [Pseudomonadota bacterium]
MTKNNKKYAAVLFDLDGTIADTAPDLSFTLNEMLMSRGREPIALDRVRSVASSGAGGLLSKGFETDKNSKEFIQLRLEFLKIYEKNLLRSSKLFEGIECLLTDLEKNKVPWGVVTNKSHRFTVPLLKGLNIFNRAACVISGDTTPHPKPHPAPLFEAARQLGLDPSQCIYIGDDERDIKAAIAANMDSVAALYGYLGINSPPEAWGATYLIVNPSDLLNIIGL